MKITKKDILQHLAIVLGIIIFFSINRYVNNIDNEIEKAKRKTVGYVYDIGYNLKSSADVYRCYYYINGKKYQSVDSFDSYKTKLYDIKEGDFFELLYHPKNKENIILLLDNPVSSDSVCNYFDDDCPFAPVSSKCGE